MTITTYISLVRRYHIQIIIYFLLCANGYSLIAQNHKIDSLKNELSGRLTDRNRIEVLYQLGYEYWDYDFEQGLIYSNECLKLAIDLKDPKGIAQGNTNIGLYYYFKGNYSKAMSFYRTAIESVNGKIYDDFPSYTYTRIGNVYRVQSQFDSALFYYDKSLQYLPAIKSEIAASSTFYNRGLVYIQLGAYDSAIHYIKASLKLRNEMTDPFLMAESWKAIGLAFKEEGQYDSAAYYYAKLEAVANQYNNPEIRIFYKIYSGELALLRGDFNSSIEKLKSALELLNDHDFARLRIVNVYMLGRIYSEMGIYDTALEYFFTAQKLNEPLKNPKQEADIFYELAYVYYLQKNPSAMRAARRAESIYKQLNIKKSIASANNLFGSISWEAKKYDSAIYYYQKSFDQFEQLKATKGMAASLFNIALIYEIQGDLENSLNYQLEALAMEKSINNSVGVIISYNALGKTLTSLGRFKEAEAYLFLARALINKMPSLAMQEENAKNLAEVYIQQKNYKQATKYLQESRQLSDSLYSYESLDKSLRMSAVYELEQKELEIINLNQSQQLQEEQLKLNELQLIQQRNFIIFTGIVILFFLGLTYQIFRSNKKLAKARDKQVKLNSEIVRQKEEIEAQSTQLKEANKQITGTNDLLEQKVEERTVELKKAYQELDTFFYRASHDFKHPLSNFKAIVELANVELTDEKALALFGLVSKNAATYDKMLSKLLSMSVIGFDNLVSTEISFEKEIEVVLEKLSEAIKEKFISVNTNIQVPAPIHSHTEILQIILEQLMENAIDFNLSGGKIDLSIEQYESQIVMEIINTGEQIRPEFADQVFDMFFRGSSNSTGNGLGLYIVRKAVTKLNGDIQLKESTESSTTFLVTFPK